MDRVRRLRAESAALFERVDVIVMPAAAALPWPAAMPYPTVIDGQEVGPRGHAVYTGWVNAAGLPGLAVPASPSVEGLPIGLQLIGAYGSDEPVARPGRSLRGRRALGRPLARTLNPSRKDTMDPITTAVQALVHARQTGKAAPAVPLPDAGAAYAVQDGVAQALAWFGDAVPRHWKSGGPSRDAVLTHAPLPPAGVWASPADARDWPFQFRGIEAEIALRLGRDVDAALAATLDVAAATALVDAMCVSIELVDSRWAEGRNAPALAKLADLQSHGALVLSDWVPFEPRDWAAQRCLVTIGTQPTTEHRGSHALADPAFVLPAWLRHATRHGRTVPAGTVVTTGTWCGLPIAAAGDRVVAAFPGIGQAAVQL